MFNSTRLSEIIAERNETPARPTELTESRILIDNTPTPFLKIKKKHRAVLADQDQNEYRVTGRPFVVQNTPNQINNKRLRKLLKVNGFADVDELDKTAGSPQTKEAGEPPTKSSMLFKPKSGGKDDRDGCDLSYETLQKMQRRRNRLVVRRSEVENMDTTESSRQEPSIVNSKPVKSLPVQLETIDEPINSQDNVPSSSPILVRRIVRGPHESRLKQATPTSSRFIPGSQFTPTMAFTYNESLTKVTRHSFANSPDINSPSNEPNEELNEADLDLILFNGLDLNKKTKKFDKMLDELFTQPRVNLMTQLDNKKRSMSVDSSGDQSTETSLDSRAKSRSNNTLSNTKLFPSQVKRLLHLSYVDLDPQQIRTMKSTVRELNNSSPNIKLTLNDSANRSRSSSRSNKYNQSTTCYLSEKLARNTTHLVLDFNEFFESNSAKQVNKKCLLLLAALNETKLIRFEWIVHSRHKSRWLDETKYLLKSYLECSSSQLPDEDEFDIQLQRFINSLGDHQHTYRGFFGSFKNVYIIEPVEEIDKDDEEEENMSLGLFRAQNTTYDLLVEILIKCGAHLTSRANQAEIAIAIDRTNELDDESVYKDEIEKERDRFFVRVNEIKKCVRKRDGVAVVSSDWVIDSLLKNQLLDLSEYQIMRISRHD